MDQPSATNSAQSQSLTLSIGLVIYQLNATVLQKTLESLKAAVAILEKPVQLFLLDNKQDNCNQAELKKLAAAFPTLNPTLIHVGQNIGYGASNNIAISASTAPFHLVVNPDIFLAPDALQQAITYLESHSDVALVCPLIFGEDGAQHYVHRKDPTLLDLVLRSFAHPSIRRLFQKRMDDFECQNLDWRLPQEISSPSGCCMLFRTKMLKAVNGFDPGFFLYYEDSDLGRRLRTQGKIICLPQFIVTHLWARASHKSLKMKGQMIKSGIRYLNKWGYFS